MNREELISRIVALETAEVVRAWAITHTTAAACNQAIHDRVLAATTGIAPVIMTMDTYTLWWVSQWVEWRKTRIAEIGDPAVAAHVRSYKDWVRATGAKAAAGMGGGSVPQTPQ